MPVSNLDTIRIRLQYCSQYMRSQLFASNDGVGVCDSTLYVLHGRSWQVIVFEPRPVAFIRIVGTHNTANEVCLTLKKP